MEQLCAALDAQFYIHSTPLVADPARSPFRIYRDVRFSKDKSPYKTNIGASFAFVERSLNGDIIGASGHRGGGYFHLSPGEIYVGGGMWHPDPEPLAAWRTLVDKDPGRVHAAIEDPAFVAHFGTVGGDRSKRMPAGYPADHPEAELLTLKDVTFGKRLTDKEAYSPKLPAILADDLGAAVPLLRLLAGLG
jgi:uncharacterized protein (TIGR02453 family)